MCVLSLDELPREARMSHLDAQVLKFKRLELPGQPLGMHMGTSYLVSDLMTEVRRLNKLLDAKEKQS